MRGGLSILLARSMAIALMTRNNQSFVLRGLVEGCCKMLNFDSPVSAKQPVTAKQIDNDIAYKIR